MSRVALVGGIVMLGVLCWVAAIGVTVVTEALVTVFALVVLVGGGNWLSGARHRAPAAPGAPSPGAAPPGAPSPGTPSPGATRPAPEEGA